ncbi:MAG TPA: SCO family protein [Candidatus Binatia bacterium]|nr:SCO family protein [Candidatus Binatia bacterium]
MKWLQFSLALFVSGLLVAIIGCRKETTYQVKGVVQEVLPARKQVRIDHERIPGYMDAMTMLFDVKDTNELAALRPGDQISFRMIVKEEDGWIDRIQRLGTTVPVVANAPENFRRVREVDPLKVGDTMPEYHFTNQIGQAVSLSDLKGQAVALTFVFTRCPFPTFCPRMSQNFEAVQNKLKESSSSPTNWHLLSITIDPGFDTPAVLKNYATQYHCDPQRWSFVTGELIDITAIAEQFGLLFWRPDPNQPAGLNHNLRTVVVTASGKVHRIFLENQWKPEDVVAAITEAAKL